MSKITKAILGESDEDELRRLAQAGIKSLKNYWYEIHVLAGAGEEGSSAYVKAPVEPECPMYAQAPPHVRKEVIAHALKMGKINEYEVHDIDFLGPVNDYDAVD